ncbi:UPF0568 protein C14orf166 homolog isoform X2 [Varroa jacobsoni]|uniref:UPF0568 protein C14orf166 homolog isoform X2 n=1 Tax=Varroa jacobsoni TaxID=62625 RepID=UPI000BF59BEB|nr:UPF0568 protein C14orf166 homolog isoform X2 [Varroa jacobsoni]
MFSHKLQALNYPNRACFNAQDNSDLRELVIWLEQMKIRQYKPEDRGVLLNTPLPQWLEVYAGYLRDAECPFKEDELTECVDWLLGHAVRLEYADDVTKYSENSAENVQQRWKHDDENPLDKLNYCSAEFKEGVNKLADLLNIQAHPTDARITFRAVSKYAEKYLLNAQKGPKKEGEPTPLHNVDLGFDLKDNGANQAARVLRLLFIQDIRELQTRINEAIVAVQKITANPKTDTSLGKVGR